MQTGASTHVNVCPDIIHDHGLLRCRQPKAQQQQQQKRPHPLSVLFGYTGWRIYFQQSTVLAGVALSLLYLTVLSLGFLMTSYLAWRGMSGGLRLHRKPYFHELQEWAILPCNDSGCFRKAVHLRLNMLPCSLSNPTASAVSV